MLVADLLDLRLGCWLLVAGLLVPMQHGMLVAGLLVPMQHGMLVAGLLFPMQHGILVAGLLVPSVGYWLLVCWWTSIRPTVFQSVAVGVQKWVLRMFDQRSGLADEMVPYEGCLLCI
ncbi:hypothetical protein DPX16_21339 [Anabarilius grahami]|uniref:Uncharacterized protein n=1 Tax=Anabarilius grahami TaxID=495550 RepID=A0A3N0XEL6_ANAGA|nr:hypothetical protein DPX16_21339 [Anabarilius grahami]